MNVRVEYSPLQTFQVFKTFAYHVAFIGKLLRRGSPHNGKLTKKDVGSREQ